MRKEQLLRMLPIFFLICILPIVYIYFKLNIQQIKGEYEQYKKESPSNNEIKNMGLNHIDLSMYTRVPKKETEITPWKVIERKESYNNELQSYRKDNVRINGNEISITSRKEDIDNKAYTSGLVESTNAYRYGYFEFTIEISKGKGIFPAIWFLPENGNALPEIDLFEMIGSEPHTFYGVIHFADLEKNNTDYYEHKVAPKDSYSVALEWKPKSLTWYIDGEAIYTTVRGIPQEDMYIIINQAIGGDWPGNPDDGIFPVHFKASAARIEPVYKKGRN